MICISCIYDRCILCCKDWCKSFKSFGNCKWLLWNFEGKNLATRWFTQKMLTRMQPKLGKITLLGIQILPGEYFWSWFSGFPQGGINVGFWRIPHFEIYFSGWLISLKCAIPKNWSCFCGGLSTSSRPARDSMPRQHNCSNTTCAAQPPPNLWPFYICWTGFPGSIEVNPLKP